MADDSWSWLNASSTLWRILYKVVSAVYVKKHNVVVVRDQQLIFDVMEEDRMPTILKPTASRPSVWLMLRLSCRSSTTHNSLTNYKKYIVTLGIALKNINRNGKIHF